MTVSERSRVGTGIGTLLVSGGAERSEALGYSTTARGRPRTSCFCAVHPAAMTGSAATVAAADSTARNCPRPSTKLPRKGGVVLAAELVSSSARKYSFHAKMKQIKPAAEIPG